MLFLKRMSAASALILMVFTLGTGVGLFLNSQVHRPAAAQSPQDPIAPGGLRPREKVPLNVGLPAAPGKNEIRLLLHAKPDGSDIDRIDIVEGQESLTAHSVEALGHYLKRLRAAEPTTTKSLVIEAGRELRFESLVKVSELCTNAGFTPSLSVRQAGPANQKLVNEIGRPFELSCPIVGQDKTYDISQSRGKLVIVYYWNTTYAGRHDDFEKLKRLQDEFGSRNVELVSVILDDDVQTVRNDLNRFRKPAIHLYQPSGMRSPLAAKNGVTKIPSIFLVGRDGKLIASGIPIDDLEDVIKKHIEERRWGGAEKQVPQ